MRLRAALAILALASLLHAEPKKPPRLDPLLVLDLDLRAVKSGDWIEYASVLKAANGKDERWTSRLACVEAGEKTVTIETERDAGEGRLWRLEVDRADGAIRAAWWGPAGGEGVAVQPPDPAKARSKPPRRSGKGSVTHEEVEAGGKTLPASKLDATIEEVDPNEKKPSAERYRWVRWHSPDLPFPRWVRHGGKEHDTVEWDAECGESGGVARMRFEYEDGETLTMEATGWGNDAKAKLSVK
jgi:hypothetical protein